MKEKIERPADIPREVIRYIMDRWSKHLEPIRHKFVEAGLAGKSFTEKAPDLPGGRLNYRFDSEGILRNDWDSKKDTGETIMSYRDFETGWRAMVDRNYNAMEAFEQGAFKLEPSADDALKMAPLMSEMMDAHAKAIRDAEKKFKLSLPKY